MADTEERQESRKHSRTSWFTLGLVAGMLLFPWLAGLPYLGSWRGAGRRVANATTRTWQRFGPRLGKACARVYDGFRPDEPLRRGDDSQLRAGTEE